MYKKILVPLDGSKRAEAILPHVALLALCSNAVVALVQVIEPVSIVADPYDPVPLAPEMELGALSQQVEGYLSGISDQLTQQNIVSEKYIAQGPVVESIVELANELDIDLIAIASHGRGGLSRVIYGSVAAGVLQRIDRPLLLIRSREGD